MQIISIENGLARIALDGHMWTVGGLEGVEDVQAHLEAHVEDYRRDMAANIAAGIVPPTWTDLDTCHAQRKAAYGPIEEQLDMIYHKGLDAWKDRIAAIKAQYPKPE